MTLVLMNSCVVDNYRGSCIDPYDYTYDECQGFDISGIIGKAWEVDLGERFYGEPVLSEFTFSSGRYSSYGSGFEERFYKYDGYLYDRCSFDWEVRNGNLYLNYADGSYANFYNITTGNNDFYATLQSNRWGNIRVHFIRVGGYAKEEAE